MRSYPSGSQIVGHNTQEFFPAGPRLLDCFGVRAGSETTSGELRIPRRNTYFMSHTKSLTAAIAAIAAIFPICAAANSITGGIHFTGDVTLTTDIDPSSPDYGDGLLTF